MCTFLPVISIRNTVNASGQTSWRKELEVNAFSKFCWPCWCCFTTGCQCVPTETSVCHSGGLIVLPHIAFTYDFYYFSLSLYLCLPSSPHFPDITPLVHVAEHSDMFIDDRSVFSATAIYLEWPHLEKYYVLKNQRKRNMYFPQAKHCSISVSQYLCGY